MTTAEQAIAAIQAAYPNPSPALAAYIEAWQKTLAMRPENPNWDFETWKALGDQAVAAWEQLSSDEQAACRALSQG